MCCYFTPRRLEGNGGGVAILRAGVTGTAGTLTPVLGKRQSALSPATELATCLWDLATSLLPSRPKEASARETEPRQKQATGTVSKSKQLKTHLPNAYHTWHGWGNCGPLLLWNGMQCLLIKDSCRCLCRWIAKPEWWVKESTDTVYVHV